MKKIGCVLMAKKEYRDLTVGELYRNGKSVPVLKVCGQWLSELGFNSGAFVRVQCEGGRIVITLNGEKALEQEAKEAFMEAEMEKLQKRYSREKDEILAGYVAEKKGAYQS